jgi:hypothetical protein
MFGLGATLFYDLSAYTCNACCKGAGGDMVRLLIIEGYIGGHTSFMNLPYLFLSHERIANN